ncbi:hypothetical protein OEA41_002452 [Lepraria neglecta]|uniref:Uncharacterized protein n=1 Tax=Lepraria neglecta TaxID=209136 RepID=A0AAD9ZBK7_9LECA|nr:hypothetical protein OEA41_002452 [Lepraria neglecta]
MCQVPSRSVNGRYQVDVRSESPRSPQPSATPPRSPMKPLPTAPDPITRVASSQKYIKTSVSPSPLHSPYLDQSSMKPAKHAEKKDSTLRSRSPNVTRTAESPEPLRSAKSPEPELSTKGSQTLRPPRSLEPKRFMRSPEPATSPQIPETAMRVRSPDLTRATEGTSTARRVKSPEPTRNVKSPETSRTLKSPSPLPEDYHIQPEKPEARAKSPETVMPFKTPAQIMSRMKEASKSSVSAQPPSRRLSITERTRSLLRKKETFAREDDENAVFSTDLPIQHHSRVDSPAKNPTSPLLMRFSSRKAKAMSMSTYSTSPTSPLKPSESPILREDSPVYLRNGKPVPTQSSYGMLTLPSLAPMKPLSPLEHPSMTLDAARNNSSDSLLKSNGPAPILKNKAKLDDSEGNVNTNHPLLQKARHTRFARNAGGDLPLRHYNSQGAFSHSNPELLQHQEEDEPDDIIPPKRSSSLLYGAQRRFLVSPEPRENSSRSPTPNQANLSAVSLAQSQTAPLEELGIHPAHRTPEPPTDSPSPSPDPSTVSAATEQGTGATPPPIETARSGKTSTEPGHSAEASRSALAPTSQPQNEPQTQDHWQPHHQQHSSASSNPLVSRDPKFKTTAKTNTPFYLNPASSTALMDFLASTPPPSPPHPGMRVDSPSGASTKTTNFFNRSFVTYPYPKEHGESSPPPPGPGSRSMTNLGRVLTGDREEGAQKKGWKKVFGGTIKGARKNSGGGSKSGKKKFDVSRGRWGKDPVVNGNGAANGRGRGEDGGFVGVGSDGVWISRKNFLKT